MKNIVLASILSAVTFTGIAQNTLKPCGTDELYHQQVKEHPEHLLQRQELENFTANYVKNVYPDKAAAKYIIPVVVHVLHDYGPENISDKDIYEAIALLNQRYSKTNAGISTIISQFSGIAADCEIEFRLAKLDPNGNCHSGIDRIATKITYTAGNANSKLNPWPCNKYLNIWTAKMLQDNVIAFANYPGMVTPSQDGVMTLFDWLKHSTLAHELGHWFNLSHVWGNGENGAAGNCTSGDDYVSDTPKTIGNWGCDLGATSCGSLDNVQNFMDYTDCRHMFTNGQKARMHAALNASAGGRNNLWTASNLKATGVEDGFVAQPCAPVADFKADKQIACAGAPIQFTDLSWKGDPSSWTWTFNGGTPSTSTDSMPVVTYNSAGTYDVTLTVGNSAGSSSPITRSGVIVVKDASAKYSAGSYTENFENASQFNADFSSNTTSGGKAWIHSTATGYSSSSCVKIDNFSNASGAVSELYLPSVNLKNIPGVKFLYFKCAYATKASGNDDMLEVYYSTDCGENWIMRKKFATTALSSVTAQSGTFSPASDTEWKEQNVSISPIATQDNVLFKFVFTCGASKGNNIYIDDINLPAVIGMQENLQDKLAMTAYNNRAENGIKVKFDLPESAQISCRLSDVTGRTLDMAQGTYPNGESKLSLANNMHLMPGLYFVTVNYNGQSACLKVMLE